jgi:hypothetical protein
MVSDHFPQMTKKTTPKKPAMKKPDADELTIRDIARELKLDPKVARARLRAAGRSATDGRSATRPTCTAPRSCFRGSVLSLSFTTTSWLAT